MNTLPVVVAAVVLMAAVAHWKRIYPHRPMVIAAAVPALLSLLLIRWPSLFWPLIVVDVAIVLILLVDAVSVPRPGLFSCRRETGPVASLLKAHRVTLAIANHDSRSWPVWIRDGAEEELHPEPQEFSIILSPRSRSTVHYDVRPGRRGKFKLEQVFLRVRSRLGFWQRLASYPVESTLSVYPDMVQLSNYEMLARKNRLSLVGFRRTRRVGQDHEFERLRDYTRDDNYRHIDWRSTARRNRLTVKDFQSSQSQRVVFLVDCGRMMTNQSDGISLLDHALNAVLMLSFVALRQGDQAGLLCFSDRVHDFVPPAGGMNQMTRLLHACFDRFPREVESRYDEAFLHLTRRCRKRALVVLITNVIDEVNAHQVLQYLTNLVGRHLPLGVLLRDRRMFEAVELPVGNLHAADEEALFRAAAAADILGWRQQVLTDMENQGILSVDVFPDELTTPLVNRYLEIKARHLL